MRGKAIIAAVIAGGVATGASAGAPARTAAPAAAQVRVPEHVRTPTDPARLEAAPAPVAGRAIRLDDPRGHWRTGFGGTLVDLVPFAHSGFHLSAGGRLFGRPRTNPALDERGLLAAPRFGGGRGGGRRFAPALLMGVGERAGAISFGLDAGVVMGAAMDRGMRGPRGFRRGRSGGGGGGGGGMAPGPNGVARLTMGYRF